MQKNEKEPGSTIVSVDDDSHRDRAVTLVFALPVAGKGLRWLADPRRSMAVEPGREYMDATQFQAGANGRVSRYPLGAVADRDRGRRAGHRSRLPGLLPHRLQRGHGRTLPGLRSGPDAGEAGVPGFASAASSSSLAGGFRGALARYYELYPEAFRCRTPEQGLWMPFAKISQVRGWEDFGFKFKEGNDETAWDDAARHHHLPLHGTDDLVDADAEGRAADARCGGMAEARRLADQGNAQAKALFTSGYHDAQGRLAARLLDTPWCNGAVWSMNSMPGIAGEMTDFKNKWNPAIREQLYGPHRQGDLDGEYIDSSEGYVTDELDFRRDHFAAARTPLTFSRRGASAGHLPRPDRLRIRPRNRGRHPRPGQTHDGQRRPATGSAGSPPCSMCWVPRPTGTRRRLAAHVRCGSALSPGDVQGQAVLFPDEHPVRGFPARPGRKVHEALPGLRDVSGVLQPQRLSRGTTSPGPNCTIATGRSSSVTCRSANGWRKRAGNR